MKRMFYTLLLLMLALTLMAFVGELPERVDQVIAGVITFLIMLLGPKPLKAIFDWLGIPGGAWRLVGTYVVSFIIGLIGLLVAGAITDLPTSIDDVLALAGLLMAAVNAAFHRLKDLGRI